MGLACRYEEDMDERLDASVKRILQQNRRAAQEVQTLSSEAILLQKENEVLLGERKELLQVRAADIQSVNNHKIQMWYAQHRTYSVCLNLPGVLGLCSKPGSIS